jgi:kynureninase
VPRDSHDALAPYLDRFVDSDGMLAYLDGNSLGRPLKATAPRLAAFVEQSWGGRLIRGWDEDWMGLGERVGDRIGASCLGAAAGQTVVGDSTSVLLYKLIHAALRLRPDRRVIVAARDDFPTDRYVVAGIAEERGLELRWVESAAHVDEIAHDVALVLLSAVAYRSGYLADVPALTRLAHDSGALVLWDLCHSVGVVPTELDAWGVDLAVGCTYKYLNGGPGSPAFAYVAEALLPELRQPIHGWLGTDRPFEMGRAYEPADGIRRMLSGTPPVIGMLAMHDMLDLIDEVGLAAIRQKSVALTQYAIELVDARIPDAVLATPRDAGRRGGHITIDHPAFVDAVPRLWEQGVLPDFRAPDGIRLGLSPLSTSYDEVEVGVEAIARAI